MARGGEPLVNPTMLRNATLRSGLVAFFFQYLLQMGLFFIVPLFLSVALGLSAIDTGVRLLPLSVTLLVAAVGIPKVWPHASPRRVVRTGFFMLFLGIVTLVALLEEGAGAEITTWPMLLAGLGIGALASQLGAVTVSSVPDEETGEVGGLQNTVTNLGASIGTAVAGAVLITILTSSFLTGLQGNDEVPDSVSDKANTELASGIPFVSDADLQQALEREDVPPEAAEEIVEENEDARLEGLRAALAVLALFGVLALFSSRRIPDQQPTGSAPSLRLSDAAPHDHWLDYVAAGFTCWPEVGAPISVRAHDGRARRRALPLHATGGLRDRAQPGRTGDRRRRERHAPCRAARRRGVPRVGVVARRRRRSRPGCTPRTVSCCSTPTPDDAVALGTRFDQDAVYVWHANAIDLLACDGSRHDASVGSRPSGPLRIDDPRGRRRIPDASCSDAACYATLASGGARSDQVPSW